MTGRLDRCPLAAQLTLTFRDPAGRRIAETERITILPERRL